jgi:rhomboid protease GluP
MKTTWLLIAVNILIYLTMLALGGFADWRHFPPAALLDFGSLYAPAVARGEWWRVVTAVFIHVGPIHLTMNMVALHQVGEVVERRYGAARFFLLYLACGLGGSAASLAWHWRHPINSAGASGAICGLIGVGSVAGHYIGGPDGRYFRDAMLRWVTAVLLFGLVVKCDNAAHAGGLVVGLLAGWWVEKKRR